MGVEEWQGWRGCVRHGRRPATPQAGHPCRPTASLNRPTNRPNRPQPPARYTAKNILIAVGGRATKLAIPGAELCITSDEALELPACPGWVLVCVWGGG